MPLLGTRGSASAKAFGFTSGGSAPVLYVMQDSGGKIWKNSSPALNSGTATQLNPLSPSYSQIQYEAPAVFTSGSIIASNNFYSSDSGQSWVTYKPLSTNNTLNANSAGFNTGVAFNPANGYVLSYWPTQYEGKAGYRASVRGYTGTSTAGTSMPTSAGRQPRALCYVPTLGGFYLANNNGETWRIPSGNLNVMTVVTNTGTPLAIATVPETFVALPLNDAVIVPALKLPDESR